MMILNDREVIDSLGMFDLADGEALRARNAVDAARSMDLPEIGPLSSIVVLGMGGSGLAGDVLAVAARDRASLPVAVIKGSSVPNFVGPDSLVFAVSYTGNTEETLAATAAALDAGAIVVAVTAGGVLGDIADERDLLRIPVPWGAQPRAMLAAQAMPLVVVCERLGLIPGADADISEALERIETCTARFSGSAPEDKNEALAMARKLDRRVPLVYGTPGPAAVAAYRWKCEINQNAKAPAFSNAYTELDHTEICGWGQHGDLTRQVIAVVQLRRADEPQYLARRIAATTDLIEEAVASVLDVSSDAKTSLGALFDLAMTGDYVSLYLAAIAEVDPGPIEVVDRLRASLGP